jgi:hypothetical protein
MVLMLAGCCPSASAPASAPGDGVRSMWSAARRSPAWRRRDNGVRRIQDIHPTSHLPCGPTAYMYRLRPFGETPWPYCCIFCINTKYYTNTYYTKYSAKPRVRAGPCYIHHRQHTYTYTNIRHRETATPRMENVRGDRKIPKFLKPDTGRIGGRIGILLCSMLYYICNVGQWEGTEHVQS